MRKNKWFDIQLFAEGGEGGTADAGTAEQGVQSPSPADTQKDRVKELGIPERYRKTMQHAQSRNAVNVAGNAQPETEKQQTTTDTTEAKTDSQTAKKTIREMVKDDPELNAELQSMFKDRLRSAKDSEAKLNSLAPILDALGAKYRIDTSNLANLDIEALTKAVSNDDLYYEDKAEEMGVSVEHARELALQENTRKREEAARQADFIEQKRQEFNENLMNQADAFRNAHPELGLSRGWLDNEIRTNQTFARMLAPGVNLPVETAYYACYKDKLQQMQSQAVAQGVRREIANSIQAKQGRPKEAGTQGQASSLARFDYAHMSAAQRKEFLDYARRASARGEKVFLK